MHKSWCTILKISWHSLYSCYQFLEFWWMILIGIHSIDLEQAIGMKIRLWIALEWWFQFWLFSPKFQVCSLSFCAAFSLCALGFSSSICSEQIRSTKLNKIQCNNGFWKFDFKDLFHIFFQVFLVQNHANQSNSFLICICTKSWWQNLYKKIC